MFIRKTFSEYRKHITINDNIEFNEKYCCLEYVSAIENTNNHLSEKQRKHIIKDNKFNLDTYAKIMSDWTDLLDVSVMRKNIRIIAEDIDISGNLIKINEPEILSYRDVLENVYMYSETLNKYIIIYDTLYSLLNNFRYKKEYNEKTKDKIFDKTIKTHINNIKNIIIMQSIDIILEFYAYNHREKR